MTSSIIGIDLGTTHSCVVVYEHDAFNVLANKQGKRTTPSWVNWSNKERLVGEPAMDQAVFDLENTIYDSKRLIGRRFDDNIVQNDIRHWFFSIISENNFPRIKAKWNGMVHNLKPEEISASILCELKEIAEIHLDKKVTKAVITVPAYFNDSQRQATMDAGKIAGLEVVRLLNEPTAAALAYAVKKPDIRGTVLIFDLGGGTLDVSIVEVTDSRFIVKATKGNTHLGGEDFTNRLFNYMAGLFNKSYGKTALNHKSAIARLKQECESAKKRLSFVPKMTIYMDNVADGKHFKEEIKRDKFCKLNADLFELILEPIKDALKDAGITKGDVDKIIMVGGSSRIPKIQEKVKEFFGNNDIYARINPDEAVACGAAVYAAIRDGVKISSRDDFIIEDVIPRSLGIACGKNSEMTVSVIDKNSAIPVSKSKQFATSEDNQTGVTFAVYEGDSPHTKDNTLLDEFVITDVPPNRAGVEKFNVSFSINSDGLLKVSAINTSTGHEMKITVRRRIGSKFE